MRLELSDDPTAFHAWDWTDVVLADPNGTFFHTPAYLKLWWEEFGGGSLVVASVTDQDRRVGACCLQVEGRTLSFLGGLDVTDYMGPVALPGFEEAVAKELVGALATEVDWVRADLRGLPASSAWSDALDAGAAASGLRSRRDDDGVSPILSLPDSYDAYLAALPSKLRHEIKRKERRLRAEFGDYTVSFATEESLPEYFDRFIELHKQSPGPKGKFMHAGMEIFFRRLGEAFLPPHVFHLGFIEVDGEKAAAAIGFAFKDTFSLYNSAFDRRFSQWSPGMVLIADMIAEAVREHRLTFDLLKGDLDYKYRFGALPEPIGRLLLER